MKKLQFLRFTELDKNYKSYNSYDNIEANIKGLGVHALSSTKWTTVEEFIEFQLEYERQYTEWKCPTIELLLSDLTFMLWSGVVKMQYIECE